MSQATRPCCSRSELCSVLDQSEDVRSCQPACAHQYTCCAGWVNRNGVVHPKRGADHRGRAGGVLVLSIMLLVAMLVHRKRRRRESAPTQADGAGADKTEVKPARQPFIPPVPGFKYLYTTTSACQYHPHARYQKSQSLCPRISSPDIPVSAEVWITFLEVPRVCPSTSSQACRGGLTYVCGVRSRAQQASCMPRQVMLGARAIRVTSTTDSTAPVCMSRLQASACTLVRCASTLPCAQPPPAPPQASSASSPHVRPPALQQGP